MDIEKKALVGQYVISNEEAWKQRALAAEAAHEADNARHAAEMEAFRREVSEACNAVWDLDNFGREQVRKYLSRFIIPQVDPLVELAREMVVHDGIIRTKNQKNAIRSGVAGGAAAVDIEARLRAALTARGFEIVKKEPSQ